MNEYLKRNIEGSTNQEEIERFKRYLRPGLQLLTPRQQQIVKMYYVDGMNEPQIANKLGVSQQGVSKRLNAAINNMKRNITIMLHLQNKQPL